MIVVLAGHYKEFQNFLSQVDDPENYFYGESADRLRGKRFEKVVIFGTFWLRNGLRNGNELLKIAESQIRYEQTNNNERTPGLRKKHKSKGDNKRVGKHSSNK